MAAEISFKNIKRHDVQVRTNGSLLRDMINVQNWKHLVWSFKILSWIHCFCGLRTENWNVIHQSSGGEKRL